MSVNADRYGSKNPVKSAPGAWHWAEMRRAWLAVLKRLLLAVAVLAAVAGLVLFWQVTAPVLLLVGVVCWVLYSDDH